MFVSEIVRKTRPDRASASALGHGGLLHQFIGVPDRDRQVRAAKITQNGEVHANDLAIAIEEWSAGTA